MSLGGGAWNIPHSIQWTLAEHLLWVRVRTPETNVCHEALQSKVSALQEAPTCPDWVLKSLSSLCWAGLGGVSSLNVIWGKQVVKPV